MQKKIFLVATLLLMLGLVGCGGAVQPRIDEDKKEIKAPVERKTTYDNFLRDIGKMYRVYYSANNPIYFQSKPITNDTASGGLPVDVSKMVISAISKVGKPIVYIPYDPNYLINEVNTGGQITRVMPKYVISGAITEYDKGVMQKSGGSSFDFFVPFASSGADGSASKDNSVSASRIVMDFFLMDYKTQAMIPGVQTTKTITIFEQSNSKDVGFHIFGTGFGINGSVSRKQGTHAALRLLIELSLAEILAKEAGIPYWKLSNELKTDQGTIDKVFDDMDMISDEIKIILLKEYLNKYGFRISDVENPTLDAKTKSYYEILQKDFALGDLGDNYITTQDLVTIHFNVPYKRDGKKYRNSMASNISPKAASKPTGNSSKTMNDLDLLLSNINKISSISSSVYVGSIVDVNNMYKTPFSEDLENKIKESIKQNNNLTLKLEPINLKQKTRAFKKKKKNSEPVSNEIVEIVGYVEDKGESINVELQVLNKDSQRVKIIKQSFRKEAKEVTQNTEETSAVNNLEKMVTIAKTNSEMKTDEIFFMTEKGDTHQIYHDGEVIKFAVGTAMPAYIYIFDIDSQLQITTLFDSTVDTKEKQVIPNELYMVPPENSDFEIVASAPFGQEVIKLIVTTKPIKIPKVNSTRSFQKKAKSDILKPEEFIDYFRKQALENEALIYEKTIVVETRKN